MSNVIVFGANGRTGLLVVREALRLGHDVTAAVRDPARWQAPAPEDSPGAGESSVVRADVRDAADVRSAVAGHDVVVSAIGPPGRHAHGLYSDAARALVSAMEGAGVPRLIAVTSGGVHHRDPNFPWWYRNLVTPLVRELYDDMRLMETIVRASTVDWTFVRPARLQDEPPTGNYRVLDASNPKGGRKVTRTDLARFIARELDEHRWSHAAPTLAE
ncbi:glycerol-3-phosphate dehydrogenase [Embleya scabrispora]|uniref:Glycerol-3-phosphate dehydrogenase n=1 Tax=Embleya scabrispora TaxID=159449 RepID=A0A1T3NKT9_9ACTN|nr:SDR family oxidoreductase [Embleya scabrispora]OPC77271.1 glycerol-3-phosphate dehydrogenase [Embleya scabrispora]